MTRTPTRLAALAGSFLLAAASAAAQTTPYALDIDRDRSNFTFSGNTSLGPIVGNPSNQFQMDGIVDMLLDPPGGPFSTGQFSGSHMYTYPSTLSAKIPNPIPWLPPLATIDVVDAVYRADSAAFNVDPVTGAFTATVVFTAVHGYTRVEYLGNTTITSLVGSQSNPTPISGTISVSGTTLILNCPVNATFTFTDPLGGTGTLTLQGRLIAGADLVNPPMVLRVGALTAGQTGTFAVTGCAPSAWTYLAYGLRGLGDTYVPQLNVTLGILSPQLAGSPQRANASGAATWNLPIPPTATGVTVRLQSAQYGDASNIWLTTVL